MVLQAEQRRVDALSVVFDLPCLKGRQHRVDRVGVQVGADLIECCGVILCLGATQKGVDVFFREHRIEFADERYGRIGVRVAQRAINR